MSVDIDTNKLVVEFVQANLDNITNAFGSLFKLTKNRLRAHIKQTYETYLNRLLQKHSRSKSFFVRSEPIPLYEFYVPLDIGNDSRQLSMPGTNSIAAVSSSSIITGTGGAGKSLLMRHLLIDSIDLRKKTPIFLELRDLNKNDRTLIEQMLLNLRISGLAVDSDYLDLALKLGHFCIFLDGYDEVEPDRQDNISKYIRDIAEQYPENLVILSSRPDAYLEGWPNFAKFEIRPLSLDRALQLVKKVPFDEAIKLKFAEDLESGLYMKHKSFLSNPLLLSIMLLTYSDNAHIPGKLSLFYSQAYESLFQKHDALKGGFQRERRTALDIQDFGKVFSAFCLQTYDKDEFSFSRTTALSYLDKAKVISRIDYGREAFLDDAIQAVCLLIEDGLQIVFAHRSFQEYFVAKFIYEAMPEVKKKLLNRYRPRFGNETIMALMYELDPEAVEEYFILPEIENIKESIGVKKKVGMSHFLRFLKIMFVGFAVEERDGEQQMVAMVKDSAMYSAIAFLRWRVMGPDISKKKGKVVDRKNSSELLVQTYGSQNVPTTKFKVSDRFVRELAAQGPWMWNIEFLDHLFEISRAIKHRQQEAADSLDSVLGRQE